MEFTLDQERYLQMRNFRLSKTPILFTEHVPYYHNYDHVAIEKAKPKYISQTALSTSWAQKSGRDDFADKFFVL